MNLRSGRATPTFFVAFSIQMFLSMMWLRNARSMRKNEIVGQRRERGECEQCGYSLTGNTSGVCPECGTPVSQKAEATA
jgi:rRNA maturation endonuclease Nob1